MDVVQLPNKLERLSKRIKKNMKVGHEIRSAWIESKIEMACDLLEARLEFRHNDNRFHDWLIVEGLGDNALPKDDRAALIAMGANPEHMRTVLKATNRWSPRYIYEKEWEVSLHSETTSQDPKRGRPSIKTGAARDIIRAKMAAGEAVSQNLKIDGISAHTVRRAIEQERGRLEVISEAEAREATYTKAQNYHIETTIKIYRRELDKQFREHVEKFEADFEAKVQKRFEEAKAAAWPLFERETEQARLDKEYYRKLIDGHRPPFTIEEFRIITMALHPDNSASEETRARALQSFTQKKLQLTGKV
jgi:hypothetical protein